MEELKEKILLAFDQELFGNTFRDYTESIVAILIGILLVKIFQRIILKRVQLWTKATSTSWDDLLMSALEKNAVPALLVLIFYLALRDLQMKVLLRTFIHSATTVAITVLAIRVILGIVNHGLKARWLRHGPSTPTAEKNLTGIITITKIVVWILGSIILLDNLGIKVSAFVAGLGITGIAVALAGQTILADLFSYFVIFFDQPFEVGHVIKVDNFIGEVEHLGIKTTRLRSLDGEQIIISNKFLTDSRVQNFRRMHRRRAAFNFELSYGTKSKSLSEIPLQIKALLEKYSEVTFERSHLKNFTPTGLHFETIYFVETSDFIKYMDIQHEVNLSLIQAFNEAGIEFSITSRLTQAPQG